MDKIGRRELLIKTLKYGIACGFGFGSGCSTAKRSTAEDVYTETINKLEISSAEDKRFIKEAMFYSKLNNNMVLCKLCPRACQVPVNGRGYCGVRKNNGGIYNSLVFSRPCALHADPIEKKPFFHYLPATKSFSLGTAGCNFNCKFCQNWEISQFKPEEIESFYLPPEKVVAKAIEYDCKTVACTYSEPIIFYEYMYEIARAGKSKGIKCVMISNGYINKQPMTGLCKILGAVKIDLKGFSEDYYDKYCNGDLESVLNTLKTLKSMDIWFEIVVLIIPTLNDNLKEIKSMSQWIKKNLGRDVPLHFSRFYPVYQLKNLPSTPVKTLEQVREAAINEGLHYVYMGNVPGHPGENTYCPKCGKTIIKRLGFEVRENLIKKGKCSFCNYTIAGVWG